MTSLVFFGAGASKPFGIPTMQDMVSEFEYKLKNENPEIIYSYSKIKDALAAEYGNSKTDVESVLSVIDGMSENLKPAQLGHFMFYYTSSMYKGERFTPPEIESAKLLRKKLRDYIKNVCDISTDGKKVEAT